NKEAAMAEQPAREIPAPVRAASSAHRPVTRDDVIDEYVAIAYSIRTDRSVDDRAVDCLEIKFPPGGGQTTRVKLCNSRRALQTLRRMVAPAALKARVARQLDPASRGPDDLMLLDPTARRRTGWLKVVNIPVPGVNGADRVLAPHESGEHATIAPTAVFASR